MLSIPCLGSLCVESGLGGFFDWESLPLPPSDGLLFSLKISGRASLLWIGGGYFCPQILDSAEEKVPR